MLDSIKQKYGIDYRHSLADIIEMNTDADVRPRRLQGADRGRTGLRVGRGGVECDRGR